MKNYIKTYTQFVNETKSEMIKCSDNNIADMISQYYDRLQILDVSKVTDLQFAFDLVVNSGNGQKLKGLENWKPNLLTGIDITMCLNNTYYEKESNWPIWYKNWLVKYDDLQDRKWKLNDYLKTLSIEKLNSLKLDFSQFDDNDTDVDTFCDNISFEEKKLNSLIKRFKL